MSERPEPRWLSVAVVRAIHADQVRQHGGHLGVRAAALLESALERADLCDVAAAAGYGIARNHPFVDGNKRVAFQVMYVFLGLNGLRIIAAEPEVVGIMVRVAAGAASEADLVGWLRAHAEAR